MGFHEFFLSAQPSPFSAQAAEKTAKKKPCDRLLFPDHLVLENAELRILNAKSDRWHGISTRGFFPSPGVSQWIGLRIRKPMKTPPSKTRLKPP